MTDNFIKTEITDKAEKYKETLKVIRSTIEDEPDFIANLANISAILKMNFDEYSWVGFYLWKTNELVLGPFQGKPACIRIKKGSGVCGTAIKERKTILVPDVAQFPGHIYCDPMSKSEIVIPMYKKGKLVGVLDVDSHIINYFDDIDRFYLEHLVKSLF